MLIDPFVVIAQIINFLILVVLLKRFLYKPIAQAMEARSQRIERQLATAAAKEKDAEAEKELYRQKQQELEAQKQGWLEQAQQEVEQEKDQLTQQAQAEVNLARSQWYDNFEQDRQKFTRQLRDSLSQQVSLTSRKALSDLANANLEVQIIETFIDRMYNLDELQTKKISNIPISNPQPIVTIRSSFTIPNEPRNRLIAAIRKQIVANAEIEFEMLEDFICGIELGYGGYKIAWNIEHYLTELEAETVKLLSENNK